jgi:hypothetical protein
VCGDQEIIFYILIAAPLYYSSAYGETFLQIKKIKPMLNEKQREEIYNDIYFLSGCIESSD